MGMHFYYHKYFLPNFDVEAITNSSVPFDQLLAASIINPIIVRLPIIQISVK